MKRKKKQPRSKIIDSAVDKEFPNHRIFAVSYDPHWQIIRTAGSFRTVESARKTIAEVRRYIVGSKDAYDRQCRAWRAANYMNAVPIGQVSPLGIQKIPPDAVDFIVDFRNEMKRLREEVKRPSTWDWNYTRQALVSMCSNPKQVEWLTWHYSKLLGSRANSFRRQEKPELHYYLKLVSEVLE